MKYKLVLYVNLNSLASALAIENLKQLMTSSLDSTDYEIETIDVNEHPELADSDNIIVTPTVIRKLPEPVRSMVGDMSFKQQVLKGLQILEKSA